MPSALRLGDIKFVTDSSAETVAYSDFLELHNSCTTAAEHDVSGPDRAVHPNVSSTGPEIDGFAVGQNFLGPCFCPMISAIVIDILHVDSARRDRLHARRLQGQNGLRETYPDPRSGPVRQPSYLRVEQ